jgi:hypothetical protein
MARDLRCDVKLNVPDDELKSTYIVLMIGLSIGVVLGRFTWWSVFSSVRGPLGLFSIPVFCPFLCLFALGALGFIFASLVLAVSSLIQTRSPVPTLVLAMGIFLAFQVPMPPRPDTPEKRHFLTYRADFEHVVEMARAGELEPGQSECPNGYQPPKGLEHVSAEGYIYIWQSSERGLTVEFNPLAPFYHPVVYIEHTSAKQPCDGDAVVEQKIDAHWYVCQVEWN